MTPQENLQNFVHIQLLRRTKKLILHFEVVDKREVGLKSPNMEREALIRALNFLMHHLNVVELITDASTAVHINNR